MTERNPVYTKDDYRPCVGIALFNAEGRVFVGERLDNPGGWQMPQGGVDEDENLEDALFREMEEETGTRNAELLHILDDWLYYDLPDPLQRKLWRGRYRGQRQKWAALRFLGDDSEIDLESHEHPEFSRWQWVQLDEVMGLIVPFKRDIYTVVIEEFRKYSR